MKNNYDQRKQNRIKRAEQLADKNAAQSEQLYSKAKEMSSVIPFGQPILIGHHSEKRDRRYREQIHNTFGKAFHAADMAKHYRDKAETIAGNDAISSDDPEAITKLKNELKHLNENHEFLKSAIRCAKKNDKTAFMLLKGATEDVWYKISNGMCGFNGFTLSNNLANMRRIKHRIKELEIYACRESKETIIKEVRIVENVEANRLQLFFPSRVSKETYKALRKNGFVWCPSAGAFQRQLKTYALRIAKDFLNERESFY